MRFTKEEIDALIYEMLDKYQGAEVREDGTFIPEETIRAVLMKLER